MRRSPQVSVWSTRDGSVKWKKHTWSTVIQSLVYRFLVFFMCVRKKGKAQFTHICIQDSNQYYAAENQILVKRVFKKIMDKKLTILWCVAEDWTRGGLDKEKEISVFSVLHGEADSFMCLIFNDGEKYLPTTSYARWKWSRLRFILTLYPRSIYKIPSAKKPIRNRI